MDSTRNVVEWILASIHFGKCGQIWRRNFQGFGCWTAAFAVHPMTDGAIFLVHLWARGGRNWFDRDVLYFLLLGHAKDGQRGQEPNEGKNTASSHYVPLSDVQNSPQGVSHLNGRELLFGEANQYATIIMFLNCSGWRKQHLSRLVIPKLEHLETADRILPEPLRRLLRVGRGIVRRLRFTMPKQSGRNAGGKVGVARLQGSGHHP